MGNSTGSFTAKAVIIPSLYPFTKWDGKALHEFLIRGQHDLAETFGLRRHEFEFMVGLKDLGYSGARTLFSTVFDTDRNGLVDKVEAMCIICMASKVSSREKLEFFFELFNFNNKGYLNESELTLLIMAVTRGSFKIDQKFIPPTSKAVKDLVEQAFTFSKVEQRTLRKPELLQFVLNNPDVTAYLECWRGHSAQVLLPDDYQWRDLSFPCNDTAIFPSKVWYKIGLPDYNFIHWRRKNKVGHRGCNILFAHNTSFLKTFDRRKTYEGEGALGIGFLKQGLLADLWILNAFAAMTARPDTLTYIFGSTGQEEDGRYCIRFYEGGGWRTVYVDDRLPCAPDNEPLFARSSCGLEAWPLLIEKGLAKYFGSYGHIALCSMRGDSPFAALRLLTGGHILKYFVPSFDWCSSWTDVQTDDGLNFVLSRLKEGSLVSFGRSVCKSTMMHDPTATVNSAYIEPPVGRLFPLVGSKKVNGFMFLIFRDSWGMIGDRDASVNFESGHSNTFQVPVEDIPVLYDTIVISRFPDCLRTSTDRLRLLPWKSEVYSSVTEGVKKPAVFKLVVSKAPPKALGKYYRERTQDDIEKILSSAEQVENPDQKITVRLKDRHDFSRDHSKLHENPLEKLQNDKKKSKFDFNQKKISPVQIKDDLVDISFTVSSACDWSVSGSAEVGAMTRMRLIPSDKTKLAIQERQRWLDEQLRIEKEALRVEKHQKSRLEDMASAAQSEVAAGLVPPPPVAPVAAVAAKERGPTPLWQSGNLSFTQAGSWLTGSFYLLPGEYFILADSEYTKVPYDEAKLRSLPRDITEAPWVEPQLVGMIRHQNASFAPKIDRGDDASQHSVSSLANLEQQIFGKETLSAADRELLEKGRVESEDKLTHRIWLEMSSLEGIDVTALSLEDLPPTMELPSPLLPEKVAPQTWPFSSENQSEVASRELANILTAMRDEAEELGSEFVTIASKYKEERKRILQAKKDAVNAAMQPPKPAVEKTTGKTQRGK